MIFYAERCIFICNVKSKDLGLIFVQKLRQVTDTSVALIHGLVALMLQTQVTALLNLFLFHYDNMTASVCTKVYEFHPHQKNIEITVLTSQL